LKHNERLEILNLRGNNFHGPLPQDIINECALQIIDLNGNKLEGKLPVSMINCQMLQVLDLGNNLIVDTYPEWLGVLPLLKVLVLKSNGFHGPIDYEMNKQTHPFFPELQVLDLSSNYFNGSIPARFLKQFKAMMVISPGAPTMYVEIIATSPRGNGSWSPSSPYYRESVTVSLKGQETTLVQILSVFMYIDLSNNNFMGVIPNAIGDLKFLKQLNLSRNSFTGEIPPRIANMLQLESLDLSYNQLSGEIPPAMAAMSFLEVLNLSYNHLSGMIPQSSQFLTFPITSFLGNDRLCGKPLARLCETNHAPSAAATPGSSKELNWEFLSVEVGVVSGLAIVAATMLLWGNGRGWVYWHVDKFWLQVVQPWICRRRH
jgi:Leucine-rich repeat (LRR) protein